MRQKKESKVPSLSSSPRRGTMNPLHGLEVELADMSKGGAPPEEISEDDMKIISVEEHAKMIRRDRIGLCVAIAIVVAAAVAIALNFKTSPLVDRPNTDVKSKHYC